MILKHHLVIVFVIDSLERIYKTRKARAYIIDPNRRFKWILKHARLTLKSLLWLLDWVLSVGTCCVFFL